MSKVCQMFVHALGGSWAMDGRWAGNKVQTMSKACPCAKFVHWLAMYKVCPEFVKNYTITTDKGMKSNHCPKSVQVQCLSNVKCFDLWTHYLEQSLDKYWISMSNLCPISTLLDGNCTNSVLHWTESGQSLYLMFYWTDIWQGFDRYWTEIRFFVQYLSNQPMNRSTQTSPKEARANVFTSSAEVGRQ